MKTKVFALSVTVIVSVILLLNPACNKSDDPPTPADYLTLDLPGMDHRHDLYYHIDHDSRAIELLFDEPLNENSIAGNISFSDKTGPLEARYDLIISGKLVMLRFHDDFSLQMGWRYTLKLSHGLQSISGSRLPASTTLDIRTTAGHVFTNERNKAPRNAIVCISDIHLGDARANASGYSWFGQNKTALEAFLDTVYSRDNIHSVVILGDLFDEWVVPYEVSPFDSSASITSSRQYFHAIADAPNNSQVIDKLKNLVSHPEMELVYVPGNHDMLITEEVLSGIIPGMTWAGDVAGLGIYHPVDNIVMEHGHRYDFFNTPQPLVNPGHRLPPGYFISRLYASGMVYGNPLYLKSANTPQGSFEFDAAWTIAFLYVIHQFDMQVPDLNAANILMGGIDGYADPLSFNEVQDMYATSIEDLWPATQDTNNVPVPISVFSGIWNGHFLTNAVTEEYISQSPGMATYRVITFGHSHDPMLKVYPEGSDYGQVYANSGSWIDEGQCENPVRTFVVIIPGEWTDSEIDCVQLYQFNPATGPDGQQTGFAATLMAEENIEVDR